MGLQLARQGVRINRKKLYRLYKEERLTVRRRFRVLTLVDYFTRGCSGLIVDTSLTALRVVRELGQIIESRACPRMIVSEHRVYDKCDLSLVGGTRD